MVNTCEKVVVSRFFAYLVADVPAHGDFHSYELRVQSCVENLPELAKAALLTGELGEVHHLVLWWAVRHAAVFSIELC